MKAGGGKNFICVWERKKLIFKTFIYFQPVWTLKKASDERVDERFEYIVSNDETE